jgi:tellurite resistance protein
MPRMQLPASLFGIVLGLSGIGQAWRVAAKLWGMPPVVGEGILLLASIIWASLLVIYVWQFWQHPEVVRQEFLHPIQGCTPALLGISTLLIVLAIAPYSTRVAYGLTFAGIGWHLMFSLWHTGSLWQGGRDSRDTLPTLYLPTVAGNFTSAAALGVLGYADWGWLFMGAGMFSWVALESLILQRLWHPTTVPVAQRPLLGIQFAPPVVCAMAWLVLSPDASDHWLVMLWGYGLFQLLLGLRLGSWLGAQPFAPSYWSYTFGIAASTLCAVKLALLGYPAARVLAIPIFIGANLFIFYLAVRTTHLFFSRQ